MRQQRTVTAADGEEYAPMTDHRTEHAELVALLRTRLDKLTWRKLTDHVLAHGSAVDVGHTFHPNP